MINRDPKCVYVADSFGMAGLVQGWLTAGGIDSEVMNREAVSEFEGLPGLAPVVSRRSLEVWVIDPAQADAARELAARKAAQLDALKAERAARTGTVVAVCEDCGEESEFPAARAGRTETCSHCGAYLDVPDPDAPDDEFWRTAGDPDIR